MKDSSSAPGRRTPFLIVLLLALFWMPSLLQAAPADLSDLNGDGAVDTLDLEAFATRFLDQDWQSVDWCAFYETSINDAKYFRSVTGANLDRYRALLDFMAASYNCGVVAPVSDKSDLNGDGRVDLDDLAIFSENYLLSFWQTVDWCRFHTNTLAGEDFEGRSTAYFLRHFRALLSFINSYFACGGAEPPPNALQRENVPKRLARIASGGLFSDIFYITDPSVGSLFIYDTDLAPRGEIKGLARPLGVAVDSQGRILVGNDGRDNVEAYDPASGQFVASFGEGLLKMPNAITVDGLGNIYVTDSRRHEVHVFDAAYNRVRTIGGPGSGPGQLKFPADAEILSTGTGQELFVADQGNKRVQVYDLEGNWRRTIKFAGTPGQNCNWFTGECEIPGMPGFTRPQALSADSYGRLHVVDSFGAYGVILNPADGAMLGAYGDYGETAGFLRVPLDVLVSGGRAIVIAGDGVRLELYDVQ